MPITDVDKIRFRRQVFGEALTPTDVARLRDTLPFLERVAKSLNAAVDAYKPWSPSVFDIRHLLEQIDECASVVAPALPTPVAVSAPAAGTGKSQTFAHGLKRTEPPKKAPSPRTRPTPPRAPGDVSEALLAALTKHPDCNLDAICKDVYGASTCNLRGRAMALLRYLASQGKVKRVGKRQWELPSRKAVIAAKASATPKPNRGTKEASPASVVAARARAAGRPVNATPLLLRCNHCAGLMFERDLVDHLMTAHDLALDAKAARAEYGEPIPAEDGE